MKIRIVKASNSMAWYADKIGEVFEVAYTIDTHYYTPYVGVAYSHMIRKEDVEEVIEHNSQLYRKVDRPVREGDTVLIKVLNGEEVNYVTRVSRFSYVSERDFLVDKDDTYVHYNQSEFAVVEPIEQPVQPSAPTYAEVSELLHEAKETKEREGFIESTVKASFAKVAEINGAALKRLADSDKDDIVEHNGKQYRKVKRKAAVGELVVVTDIIDYEMRDTTIGKVYKVVTEQQIAFDYPFVNVIDDVGVEASVDQRGYLVLEPVEQSSQLTETDLIANLAQEVASLKKDLHHAQSDIADLEDRVDENEKDTEEVIGRMNDLGDGAEAAAVVPVIDFEGLITKLTSRKDLAKKNKTTFEILNDAASATHNEGIERGLSFAIDTIKEALRNG